MRKSTKVKKTKVSKPIASTRKLKKFTNGGGNDIGTLKPKTPLEAAKDLKINQKPIATAETLEQQTASKQDLMEGLMRPPTKEVAVTPTKVSTPKSVATKSPKTVSDSYKKSLQGLMDKGKSIDELVKAGYGTKQGLTNLGLTSSKATAPKVDAKKAEGLRLKSEGLKLKSEGLRLKGQALADKGKKQANKVVSTKSYTDSKGNKTVVNKKANGLKDVRFDKELSWRLDESGGVRRKIKTYNKEVIPRSGSNKNIKWHLSKDGSTYTAKHPEGTSIVYKGKNMKLKKSSKGFLPDNRDEFYMKGEKGYEKIYEKGGKVKLKVTPTKTVKKPTASKVVKVKLKVTPTKTVKKPIMRRGSNK